MIPKPIVSIPVLLWKDESNLAEVVGVVDVVVNHRMEVRALADKLITKEIVLPGRLLLAARRIERGDADWGNDPVQTEERNGDGFIFAVHLIRLDCHVDFSYF